MNFTVPRAMPLSTLAQTMRMDPQALMQANSITNPNAMLMPGTQLMFPDTFGNGLFGGSLLQSLLQAFLQGIGAAPPSAMSGPNSMAEGVSPQSAAAARPMRQSQPSGWSHPLNAIRDRYRQYRGSPLDGDARDASADGLRNTGVKTPRIDENNGAVKSELDKQLDTHVNTPHVTQWTPTGCKIASDLVVQRTGGQHDAARINVAASRPGRGGGRNANVNIDPEQMKRGMARIDGELDRGHAVEVGLAHDNGGNHNDGITDHFVAITGRGTDAQGRRYYTFHDPATSAGSDRDPHNRFYVDPDTGGLFRPRSSDSGNKWLSMRYEVTTVR